MPSKVHPGPSSVAPIANAQPIPKINPVAHEVRVVATAARLAEGSGRRELFTEATTTVLVFENGGVIRLEAAVAAGQLLFLTNQETRREVVTQVTRKRVMGQTSCYVELEFTEPSPGFWGIEFPEMPELAPKSAEQREAVELVQSAEVGADNPGKAALAPDAHEVDTLKRQVEALREQLKSLLQTTNGAGKSLAPVSAEAARVASPDSVAEPAANAASTCDTAIEPPVDHSEPAFSEEALLTKSALDFGQAEESAKRLSKTKTKVATGIRPGAVQIGLTAGALLLVAVGVAWYRHWLPGLPQLTNSPVGAPSARPANSIVPVHSAPHKTADVQSDSGNLAQVSDAPALPSSAPAQTSLQPAKPVGNAAPPLAVGPAKDSAAQPSLTGKPPLIASVAKRSLLRAPTNTSFVSAASSSVDEVTVPPKLVKAVRPNPPEEALRDFVSGNVTLDAVVDISGHVKSMNVLSGPAKLRKAAMDTLQQYTYEPALQKGKPVPAHVNVVIQFWYEP